MAGYLLPLIIVFSLNLFAVVYDDLPDRASLVKLNIVELKVNGRKVSGEVFYSKYSKTDTMTLFRSLMKEKGFIETAKEKEILSFSKGKSRNFAGFLEEKSGTMVISYSTESGPENTGTGDMPGMDLPDIPRPAGSKREYCMERLSGKEKSVMLVYTLAGSSSSCESFYRSVLGNKGWKQVMCRKTNEGAAMAFEEKNKWCNIFISGKTAVISLYSK